MLHGSQKRFDKNGDGKLKGAEWQRWYQYAYRRTANCFCKHGIEFGALD